MITKEVHAAARDTTWTQSTAGDALGAVAMAIASRECVAILRLDAIRDALSERWPRKRDQVWDFLEQAARRVLHQTELLCRVNDTEFLLACNGRDRSTAKAIAFNLVDQTRRFFLGEIAPAAEEVLFIKWANERLELRPARRSPVASAVKSSRSAAPLQFSGCHWRLVPMRTVRGIELAVRCRCVEVLPLWGQPTSLKVEVSVQDELFGRLLDLESRRALEVEDHLRLDTIMANYAQEMVFSRPPRFRSGFVLVEISLNTVTSRRSRDQLQATLSTFHPEVRRALRAELVHIEEDTSRTRIFEGVAALQSYVGGIVPRVSGSSRLLEALSYQSWPAVSVAADDYLGNAGGGRLLKKLRRLTSSVIVHDADEARDAIWRRLLMSYISGKELKEVHWLP